MGKSADMLGDLLGRSMGLEPEWEVASSEFLEVEGVGKARHGEGV